MKLYIVRHGETSWNVQKKIQGATDISLNENGIALAKVTGEALLEVPFDFAISSPLHRAMETASLILGERKLPMYTDDRIREISFGVMEGTCLGEKTEFTGNYQQFFQDPAHYQPPKGGETLQEVCERTGSFLTELIETKEYENAVILVTSHGCAIRAMLQRFYQDKLGFWHGKVPPNCSVNLVEARGGEALLVKEDMIYYPEYTQSVLSANKENTKP